MKKTKKLNLHQLHVQSFVTEVTNVNGGRIALEGTNLGCNTDTIETDCPGTQVQLAFAFC